MKRAALSLMFSFAVAGSLYAAQNPSSPPSQQPSSPPSAPAPASPASPAAQSQDKPGDVTLTGCLVQGSTPNVWILENAKASTDPATAKGKSYVVAVTGAADLKPHLNHQVRIVGTEAAASSSSSSSAPSSPPAQPGASSQPGAPAASSASKGEASFPRLSARTVTMVAATCPAA